MPFLSWVLETPLFVCAAFSYLKRTNVDLLAEDSSVTLLNQHHCLYYYLLDHDYRSLYVTVTLQVRSSCSALKMSA